MNAILEYLFAGLLLIVMLVTAENITNTWISDQLSVVEQQDYSLASSIADVILLSPGDPPNWGDLLANPVLFGLAAHETTEMCNLDASKVYRLHENSPLYISPGELRSLLHISQSYSFAIRIRPINSLNISLQSDGLYSVRVTDQLNRPIANVRINGHYVHESLSSDYERKYCSNVTRVDGECFLTFEPETDYVLAVCADVVGAKTMQTFPAELNMIIEGDRVIESEVPLISTIDYVSGSFSGLTFSDTSTRIVRIRGYYYYFELEVRR